MSKNIFAALAVLLATALPAAAAEDYVNYYCDADKNDQAIGQVFVIEGWQSLYTFYTRFAGCDHGVVTDGISYRVADLLADHWGSFSAMRAVFFNHRSFKPFVLEHIDQAMSERQATAVLDNIRNRCPEGCDALCAEIERAVLDRRAED